MLYKYTMGIEKYDKINQLMTSWSDGKIYSSTYLNQLGYGANFIQKYKNSHWIEALASGAYKKYKDTVDWPAAIECMQTQLNFESHIGGKSALELLGKAQYLNMKSKDVIVISNKKQNIPFWVKKQKWSSALNFKLNSLFNKSLKFAEINNGFTQLPIDKNNLVISSAERAYLEYLDELPNKYSYTEAKELLENLTTLRPSVLQHLLENCTSLKTKRVFLHLASVVNQTWFERLNLNKINLGTGKRVVFKNGVLDKRFNITVPKEFNE
jgi:hypothetical protein